MLVSRADGAGGAEAVSSSRGGREGGRAERPLAVKDS